MNVFGRRPNALLKFLFKVPVWLHKMGFSGWERLVGAQWMFITTKGRKTGSPRDTMVDIMGYDRATDTYYIEAAYGTRADWYRNMKSNPVFEAQVGHRKFKAHAESLPMKGSGDMLVKFYRDKPAYTRSIMTMAGIKFKNEDDLRAIGNHLLLLAINPEKD